MLAKNILHSIIVLSGKNIKPGKTFIQKLIYLSIDEKQRRELFVPYYYGPYSETVQSIIDSLISQKYLNYNNSTLETSWKDVKFSTEEDSILRKRIDKIIGFLQDKKIKTAKEISSIAKTHLILNRNQIQTNKSELVKEVASVLGWQELSQLNNQKLNQFIKLAQESEAILD